MNRNKFLKTSAAVAGAIAVAPTLALDTQETPYSKNPDFYITGSLNNGISWDSGWTTMAFMGMTFHFENALYERLHPGDLLVSECGEKFICEESDHLNKEGILHWVIIPVFGPVPLKREYVFYNQGLVNAKVENDGFITKKFGDFTYHFKKWPFGEKVNL